MLTPRSNRRAWLAVAVCVAWAGIASLAVAAPSAKKTAIRQRVAAAARLAGRDGAWPSLMLAMSRTNDWTRPSDVQIKIEFGPDGKLAGPDAIEITFPPR